MVKTIVSPGNLKATPVREILPYEKEGIRKQSLRKTHYVYVYYIRAVRNACMCMIVFPVHMLQCVAYDFGYT